MRGESFVANNLQVSENGRSVGSGKKTVGRSVGGLTLASVGQTSLCKRSVGAGRTGGNLQIVLTPLSPRIGRSRSSLLSMCHERKFQKREKTRERFCPQDCQGSRPLIAI